MPAVWKALESMRLHGHRSRGCKPGTVGELISQEPFDTLLVRRIFCRYVARDMQGVESLASGVGIRPNAWKLAPTAVLILDRPQRLHEWRALRCGRARISERVELHGSLF